MPVRSRTQSEPAIPSLAPAFLESVHANPWADELVDYAPLNAHASQAIELAIERVRDLARTTPSSLQSTSLTVLGPAGAGKTHLFARLRRRLGPRAVFVHVRPLLGSEMTPRLILQEAVRQLGYVTAGLRQVDALVGSLLSHCAGGAAPFPTFYLMDYARLTPAAREARIEQLLETLLAVWQQADEAYLRRLLVTPFLDSTNQRAMLAWLSGRELDPMQLERTGIREPLEDGLILPALKSLAAVASVGAPIVVVFDQLENLIEQEGPSTRLLAYAQLTTDLVDTVPGLVVVQMALDTEWDRGIEPAFNPGQRSRLTAQRHLLTLPTAHEREGLLRLWAGQLPSDSPPFPWPFAATAFDRLRTEPGITPRMLLIAFRRALDLANLGLASDEASPSAALTIPPPPMPIGFGRSDPSLSPHRIADAPTFASTPRPTALATTNELPHRAEPRGTVDMPRTAVAQVANDASRAASVPTPERSRTNEPSRTVGTPRTVDGSRTGAAPDGRHPGDAPGARPTSRIRLVDAIEQAWEAHLASARATLAEAYSQRRSTDAMRLADGIVAALRFALGLKLVNVRHTRPAQILVSRGSGSIHIALLHQAHYKSVSAALTRLTDLATVHEVLVVREREVELPASWADTLLRKRTLLMRPNAHWLSLAKGETAQLIALESLVSAARSHDVTDSIGRTLKEQDVTSWIERSLSVPSWAVLRALRGDHTDRREPPSSRPPSSRLPKSIPLAADPRAAPEQPHRGTALTVLAKLRVASIERVVREVSRIDPQATRATVMAELEAQGEQVHWVGEGLVCLRETS